MSNRALIVAASLWVIGSLSLDAFGDAFNPQGPVVGSSVQITSGDGSGHQAFVDSTGHVLTSASATITFPTIGAAVPGTGDYIAGNQAGNLTGVTLDASSYLQVNCKAGCSGGNANGQATMANSAPVVIASNQSTLPVSQNAATPVSGTLQSSAVANGNGTLLTVTGMSSAVLTVNCAACSGGTTVNFEQTEDGTNYTAVSAVQVGTTTIATTTTASGVTIWEIPTGGFVSLRARVSAYSAGTITVTGHTVPVSYNPKVVNANIVAALPAGTNVIGHTINDTGSTTAVTGNVAVTGAAASFADGALVTLGSKTDAKATQTDATAITIMQVLKEISAMAQAPAALPANQSVNVAQINGVTTTMGNGVSGTGVQRVTLASDSTGQVAISTSGNNVGGYEYQVTTTPTIQNASYASGNCMGGFQTVSVARTSGGAGIQNRFLIMSKGGGTTVMTVYIFSQNPGSSTCTDKSTFTLNNADAANLMCAPFTVTPAAPTGATQTFAEVAQQQCHFKTSGNTNVYVGIVSGGTWTPASTTDLVFTLEGIQD